MTAGASTLGGFTMGMLKLIPVIVVLVVGLVRLARLFAWAFAEHLRALEHLRRPARGGDGRAARFPAPDDAATAGTDSLHGWPSEAEVDPPVEAPVEVDSGALEAVRRASAEWRHTS